MKSKLNKIRELLGDLNSDELAALQQEIADLQPTARQPTPEEKYLAPGHYFEERTVITDKPLHYLYERWYERDGRQLKHKGKMLFKGTKREYIASLGSKEEEEEMA